MKKKILKLTCATILSCTTVTTFATANNTKSEITQSTTITETFHVYGNCGMCKKTIEGSLKNVEGIEKAVWNQKTKMMEVVYQKDKISLDDIKNKIAEVGYDTDEFRATKKAYNKLAGCCKYERPK